MDFRRIYYEWKFWVKIVYENEIAWVCSKGNYIYKIPEFWECLTQDPHKFDHLKEQIDIMCDKYAHKGL
jgi:hypothetical protein